jgi:hypothetical protein
MSISTGIILILILLVLLNFSHCRPKTKSIEPTFKILPASCISSYVKAACYKSNLGTESYWTIGCEIFPEIKWKWCEIVIEPRNNFSYKTIDHYTINAYGTTETIDKAERVNIFHKTITPVSDKSFKLRFFANNTLPHHFVIKLFQYC